MSRQSPKGKAETATSSLAPNKVNSQKPSDFLFLLAAALIPVQLNKFFFFDYSYVLGLPIDYRAFSIYLSDIALVIYLLFFLKESKKKDLNLFFRKKFLALPFLAFNVYLLLTPIFSISLLASFLFGLKIALFSIFALFASTTLKNPAVKQNFTRVLVFSALWQSLLVFMQFSTQRSLNLYFLGERTFDTATPLIAHVEILGRQLLRPYGTFPHPNVLAAFFVFTLILAGSKFKLLLAFPIFAAILTFSKTAGVITLTYLLLQTKNLKIIFPLLLISAAFAVLSLNLIFSSQIATLSERLLLTKAALDLSLQSPFFGVGSNNFIPALASLDLSSLSQTRLLQPVHNVFLLILAENGILGLLLFTALLFAVAKSITTTQKVALFLAILVYASFDHFLWTLQQGQLLFWLSLGYILSEEPKDS